MTEALSNRQRRQARRHSPKMPRHPRAASEVVAVAVDPVTTEPAYVSDVKDTPSMRIVRQMIASAKASAVDAAVARAKALAQPDPPVALSSAEELKLFWARRLDDQADAWAAIGRRGVRGLRAKALTYRRQVQNAMIERVEAAALARSIEERAGYHAASGATRLHDVDGLESLGPAGSGSLTKEEVTALRAYRLCFEAANTGLRSSLGAAGEVRGSRATVEFGEVTAMALHRSMLCARLAQFERAIGNDPAPGRDLVIVRAVAGLGCSLSSVIRGGNAKDAALAALRRAAAAIIDALTGPLTVRGEEIAPGHLANQGRKSSQSR